jgi:UDP-N-acetylmuramoyl-L-alanyl-D-glutamate--2,6-diaminopimelate ligase
VAALARLRHQIWSVKQENRLRLHSLLQQYGNACSAPAGSSALRGIAIPDLEISGVQEDSRLVRPGDLFVARLGTKTDGKMFIQDATQRGAVAVVTPHPLPDSPLPQIVLNDACAASILANLFHGRPSKAMRVLAVTGTNGKTTTAYLMRHLLNKVDQRCGMIGTVELDDGQQITQSEMTTPGAIEMAQLISRMKQNGCRACATEVSSHALHQGRAAGIFFAGAGFTNLTGDHLDYHGSMENYAEAKASLFASLQPDAVAAINCDDPWADRMIEHCAARLIRFSSSNNPRADYRASDVVVSAQGTRFALRTPEGKCPVSMNLIGRHNIENALCAASLVGEVFHLLPEQISQGLHDAAGAPGRLETVRCGQSFAVLVDYAHTDDALKNVLTALRPLTKGKLRVCFGCGGDRDRTKRPRMARVASELADCIYITSDNPRTEEPTSILNEIAAGLDAREKLALIETDRRAAIEQALSDAEAEDVVLIAGKGHEDYQIIGTTRHHFDDVEECQRVLRSLAPAAA